MFLDKCYDSTVTNSLSAVNENQISITILSNDPGKLRAILLFPVSIICITTGPFKEATFKLPPCHFMYEIQSYILIIQEFFVIKKEMKQLYFWVSRNQFWFVMSRWNGFILYDGMCVNSVFSLLYWHARRSCVKLCLGMCVSACVSHWCCIVCTTRSTSKEACLQGLI